MAGSRTKSIISGCAIALFVLVLGAMILMVLPIFPMRGDRERIASCESNERQVGLAILEYVQDWDEEFPSGATKGGAGWAGGVQEYIKSESVFHCPQDATQPSGNAVPDSYAMNSNLHGVPLASLESPQHTVMAFEITGDQATLDLLDEGASIGLKSFSAVGNGTDGSLRAGSANAKYSTGYMGKRPVSSAPTQFDGGTGRHDGGANFLLVDGHFKFLMPDHVTTGSDAKDRNDGQTGGIVGRAAGTANTAFDATFSTQ